MNSLATKIGILIFILTLPVGSQVIQKENPLRFDKNESIQVENNTELMSITNLEIPEDDALSDYYLPSEEMEPELEDWMFDELYPPEDEPILEDWMFDELYPPEDEPILEDWMFDTDYFNL